MTDELLRIRETLEELIFILMCVVDCEKDDPSYQRIFYRYKKKMEEAYG